VVIFGNVIQVATSSPNDFIAFDQFPWQICFLPLIVIVGLFMRPPRLNSTLSGLIERNIGNEIWREFVNMLKLDLLFSTMGFSIVITDIIRAYFTHENFLPTPLLGFFLSGGIAFLIAYFIRRARYPRQG
jgi:hypothetical protein